MAVETSVPWLDKSSLETWLRPHYGDLKITAVESKAATAEGDNYLSDMQRVTVKTETKETISLIVKCQRVELIDLGVFNDHIFNAEKEMYTKALPKMNSLLKEVTSGTFEPLNAKCYYSSGKFVVLEDLSASGFVMLDRIEGLELEDCLVVMRSMARFHAVSIVILKECPEHFEAFHPMGLEDATFFKGMIKMLIQETETWPQEWTKYVEKLKRLEADALEHYKRMVLEVEPDLTVLCHGDVWVNNLMFRKETNSVRFVDFQTPAIRSPATDLHYFTVTSPTMEVRVNHTDKLFQEYHSTLCDTLLALRHPAACMTMERLQQELNRKSLYAVFSLAFSFPIMQSKPGDFIFDKALMGEPPGPHMYTDNFRRVVKYLLPLLERRGAFDDV